MKKILLLALFSFCLTSCSNDEATSNDPTALNVLQKGTSNSGSTSTDYLVSVSQNSDGSLWTYIISKNPETKAKDLGHYIINLNNCGNESATFANIVYANVNGYPADLTANEGQGTDCDPQAITNNFIKINVEGSGPWVIDIKFERGYEAVISTSWIKAGNSCSLGSVLAPGCPKVPYCSYSQGFFFANGALNNGATNLWTNGLTIGETTYTQADGMHIWNIDRGYGGNQVLNGFFQLGAVRLSDAEASVQLHVDIIEAYFTAVGNVLDYETTSNGKIYFRLPAEAGGITASQVAKAGGAIGKFIDENHCN
ncbi:hypothetical protein BXY82_0712 [Gelidibacter sediminis]|uniref:Lipoprotein n=1 Tax=Gelidibacter sediminis TaxID=1608710 RepID=A0A4R7Q8I1_9FLAO|nr:hypothetical protein [Gelidibacter sediminis]TDU43302.1 hypothetical protein BXY82_0712 [Gelidibacter sediminis]